MCENDPPDHVDLLRLIWDPDDIVEGQLQPSAFPAADLSGDPERYLSVDRVDQLVPLAVRYVANAQQQRARQTRFEQPDRMDLPKRDESFGALLPTKLAREIEVPVKAERKGEPDIVVRPLTVSPDKLPEGHHACPMGNDAHCAVANSSGRKSRSFMNILRAKLVATVHTLRPLDDVLDNDIG